MKIKGNRKKSFKAYITLGISLLLLPFLSSCLPPPEVLTDLWSLISVDNPDDVNIKNLKINFEIDNDFASVKETYTIENTAKTRLNSHAMFLLNDYKTNNYSIKINNIDVFAVEKVIKEEDYKNEIVNNPWYYYFTYKEYYNFDNEFIYHNDDEPFENLKIVKFLLDFESSPTLEVQVDRNLKLGGLYGAKKPDTDTRKVWLMSDGSNMKEKVSNYEITSKTIKDFPITYVTYDSEKHGYQDQEITINGENGIKHNVRYEFDVADSNIFIALLMSSQFLVMFFVLILPILIMIVGAIVSIIYFTRRAIKNRKKKEE